MTFTSRDKLNAVHFAGSIGIAAIFAALAGSWPLFIVVAAALVGTSLFTGEIRWDASKPDGQPRRCLDTQRAERMLKWKAVVGFEEGLRRTIDWWREEAS